MKHYLLLPLGSSGDVHPFVGLGRELRSRGHRVTLFACELFEDLAKRNDLEFVSTYSTDEYHAIQQNSDIWHPRKGPQTVFKLTQSLDSYHRMLNWVIERHVPGETVMVAGSLALAPRVIRDGLRIPLATVHLQPSVIISPAQPARHASGSIPHWWPHWARRWAYWFGEWMFLDPILRPNVNAFRREFQLPPIRRIFSRYVHSPDAVIGLFPSWYAKPASDWPPHMQLTAFPLYDEANVRPLSPEVQAFLATGTPPVVVTFGTAMRHALPYFTAIATALKNANIRGILLTPYAEQIPATLPAGVIHVSYVPLSLLLPQCAVMVHHGGIGTASQALKAGVPQLVMPMTHDQPDNALRLERLGVSLSLTPQEFTAVNLSRVLPRLIQEPNFRQKATELARIMDSENGLHLAANIIEQMPTEISTPPT